MGLSSVLLRITLGDILDNERKIQVLLFFQRIDQFFLNLHIEVIVYSNRLVQAQFGSVKGLILGFFSFQTKQEAFFHSKLLRNDLVQVNPQPKQENGHDE